MSSSYFYTNVPKDETTKEIIDYYEEYAQNQHLQVYLINKPLGENKYSYRQSRVAVLLIPKSKIAFINLGETDEEFDDFCGDFTEDIGIISDKYEYKKILGRPKEWKSQAIYKPQDNNYDQLIPAITISELEWQKNCDLLISLITGSINDVDRVQNDVPSALLDKIKQKIVLFDGDQTRFIYSKHDSKTITIQGLSGTGKTELLLQKLKELYIKDNHSKLLFTCWNRVLSESLKTRIPQFFNFMKVDQQIEWNKRLFCFHAWGSTNEPNSGTYRYICQFYEINFNRYSRIPTFEKSFEYFCIQAIEHITIFKENNPNEFQYAFDYSLIDESQDFPKSFFELINLVTKSTVYIAGDIFQDIFSRDNEVISNPDYLLSKCYRTDPRTLMFAHALGMGLFEEKKLRWLTDTQWNACGYQFTKEKSFYTLKREPLRRFEDLDAQKFECVKLSFNENMSSDDIIFLILRHIDMIKEENGTAKPDDIAIIFIDKDNSIYNIADRLVSYIEDKYGWEVNRAYESKQIIKNTILLSNSNNVKGLEFPFVICVTDTIGNSYNFRNTLYTMLTRSFIQSVLIVTQRINKNLILELDSGLKNIYEDGFILVKEPSDIEKEDIKTKLEAHSKSQISLQDLFNSICKKMDISKTDAHKLLNAYIMINQENEIDEYHIAEWIKFNSKPMANK